jgi:hypothetical protein
LFLGQTQTFSATVTGTSNTSVTWSVNGIAGGNAAVGTISTTGQYAAPQILPSPASVTVRATSQADPLASGSSAASLKSDVIVNVSPNSATLPAGSTQTFSAIVTGSGNPNPSVAWSVNGIGGGNATVGTITSTGADAAMYTAPGTPPSPPAIMVTATSVADPSRAASASLTIQCGAPNGISPASASVALAQTQPFVATLCVPPGTAILWEVNGITGGNSSLGTVTNTNGNAATYTAPASPPPTNPVTVRATSQTIPPQSVSAAVTVVSQVAVSISPSSATVPVSHRASFKATVTNAPTTAVQWTVNGIPNGNSVAGQICLPGSNPCAAPAAPISGSVDYLAPASPPAQNPVALVATSLADPTRTASAAVTVVPPLQVSVSISPPYAFLAPGGKPGSTQLFTASLTGTTNQAVLWTVASAVAGQGCSGAACGTVGADGLYTAPASAPSPNAIAVTATSQEDSMQSATAVVALTSGPAIETVLPSSVMAGAAGSFTLAVAGLNFVPGIGSSASFLSINGIPRTTTCPSATRCNTALSPGDVSAAGTLRLQVQNPGSPGALSNPVPLVVVPFTTNEDVIPLSSAQPSASGKDVIVVEPTNAGATSSSINVDFIGFVTGGNSCSAQGSPLFLTRPASGSATFSLCVHGNGLDPSFTYEFSGPSPNDMFVTATSLAGLFPNLMQLDVTITSATLPGPRTLFLTTPANDKTAASGMLEVK